MATGEEHAPDTRKRKRNSDDDDANPAEESVSEWIGADAQYLRQLGVSKCTYGGKQRGAPLVKLSDYVRERFSYFPAGQWAEHIASGRLRVGWKLVPADYSLRAGDVISLDTPREDEPSVDLRFRVIEEHTATAARLSPNHDGQYMPGKSADTVLDIPVHAQCTMNPVGTLALEARPVETASYASSQPPIHEQRGCLAQEGCHTTQGALSSQASTHDAPLHEALNHKQNRPPHEPTPSNPSGAPSGKEAQHCNDCLAHGSPAATTASDAPTQDQAFRHESTPADSPAAPGGGPAKEAPPRACGQSRAACPSVVSRGGGDAPLGGAVSREKNECERMEVAQTAEVAKSTTPKDHRQISCLSSSLKPSTKTDEPGGVVAAFRALAVEKSGNLPVSPSGKYRKNTLEYEVQTRLRRRLWTIHRLDKETSGVVILPADDASAALLGKAFRGTPGEDSSFVEKTYHAVLIGHLKAAERVAQPVVPKWTLEGEGYCADCRPMRKIRMVAHPDGKACATTFTPLAAGGGLTLAEVRIERGRTHQIRVHAEAMGMPILGDKVYGHGAGSEAQSFAWAKGEAPVRTPFGVVDRQLLHASSATITVAGCEPWTVWSDPTPFFSEYPFVAPLFAGLDLHPKRQYVCQLSVKVKTSGVKKRRNVSRRVSVRYRSLARWAFSPSVDKTNLSEDGLIPAHAPC
ncbi:hypothetical protein DIPPA_00461 [Diplonema papillatum]|nr:hypothetical protein DIPPA_00461 [Diplonema papillatum]